jgi:purine-binding chemotaxis protein CheW
MNDIDELVHTKDSAGTAEPSSAPTSRGVSTRSPRANQSPGEFLSFRLGTEEYGIEIVRVQEIRSYEAPTRIANAPNFVKGVVNLRGVIVPLIDLRLKFGLGEATYGDTTAVIVLNVARRVVGVVVDSVSDVVQLDGAQIKAVPEFNRTIDAAFMTGIGTVQDRMMILMDIEALIRNSDMGLFEADLGNAQI